MRPMGHSEESFVLYNTFSGIYSIFIGYSVRYNKAGDSELQRPGTEK